MTLEQTPRSNSESHSLREEVKQAAAAVDAVTHPPSCIPVSTTLPRTPPSDRDVAWLIPGLGMATKLTSSAEAAAKALGWRLMPIGFDATDLKTVNAAVEEAVDEGVDYIVALAVPSALFVSGLARAKAAGIPVVIYAVETETDASERGIIGCFSCSYASQRVGRTFANFGNFRF